MNIAKIIFALLVVAVVYWFISDAASPYMRISAYDPQKTFGDQITFDITMINFSPRPKEIYIGAGDSTDVSVLVDTANPAKPISKQEAVSTVTLPPFSNRTIQRVYTLADNGSDQKDPQTLSATDDTLTVTSGQHAVRATLGGHTSDVFTFGVR